MRKYLLLSIALLLFLNADAQLKRSAESMPKRPPMSLFKPASIIKEAKMAEPRATVKKDPQRDSTPSVYYRRPAGAFPASILVEDGYFSGMYYAPLITVTPFVEYTFNGYLNGVNENYDCEWKVQYYDSDTESLECTEILGQNLVWKWGIQTEMTTEAPIFYAINGNDTLSWQSRGYEMSGDYNNPTIEKEYPSYICSAPKINEWLGVDLLKSSKSFCYGGRNGDQRYPSSYYSGARPYGNNDDGWWFGKNGGASDSVRIDGIAQAFEKPTAPYLLKQVVVYCAVLEVTSNVKMTCKVYKLDEIPAYEDLTSAILPDEPGELIAKGEAYVNSRTYDETSGLVFFNLYGEEDGLTYEYNPIIDYPILVVIDGYNEPEMANLTDFSAMVSTDIHVDEGFGELAYLKYGEKDQEGNLDYVWKGLNNFFGEPPTEMKTGFTIFLSTENHFLTFKYPEENGIYNFPAEGGELVKQFGDITCNGINFFTSYPSDDGYEWWMYCNDGDDVPNWLHIELTDGEWNDELFSGDVMASVTADPMPAGESYREAVVRFELPGAYLDYKFTQGKENHEYLRGDVNGDGIVSILDVTALIDYLLSDDTSYIILSNADVNANSVVSITDVTCLIDYLLSGSWPNDPVTPPEEHEWVDLGLPSGTLWATCNVGANNPEDYGDYFAWGETEPKEVYDWSTYKWCNGSENTLTKYCTDSSYGYDGLIDNKTELDPEDDAATVNWGAEWRMPMLDQQKELINNCTWQWTQRNGVNGQLVTGPNGNTLFLPATGRRWGDSLEAIGSYGFFWSRPLYSYGPKNAYGLSFSSGGWTGWNSGRRDYGYTVRPVRVSQEPKVFQLSETEVSLEVGESKTIDILNGSGSYSVENGGSGEVTEEFVGEQLILTGVETGNVDVIVTDASTNASATLAVTVTAVDTIQPVTEIETFTVNGVSFTMVKVEGGTFTMGATTEQGDDALEDEFPTHQVSLSSYRIGQTEVTQALWNAVMGYYANQDTVAQLPVEVAWNTCQTFISKLNELTGRTFRLPTEAEWEFAARGGNLSHGYKYAGSNDVDAVAWYSCIRTFVATKLPNELGLYDMSGNVSEWCQDWYGAYNSNAQTNPTGPASYDSEPNRIVRGGDCRDQAIACRVSSRSQFHVACGRTGLGFRLAL